MWTHLISLAHKTLGNNFKRYSATHNTLVGESVHEDGIADPSMIRFIELLQQNIPQGCYLSIHNKKPSVFFIAATSKAEVSLAQQEYGL